MSAEQIALSAPSNLFTGSTLVLTTLIASGVAAVGLVSMFWVGTYVHDNLSGLRTARQARNQPPPPPKTLKELILERKAELEGELAALKQEKALSPQQKQRVGDLKQELWHYRTAPWYKVW